MAVSPGEEEWGAGTSARRVTEGCPLVLTAGGTEPRPLLLLLLTRNYPGNFYSGRLPYFVLKPVAISHGSSCRNKDVSIETL